MNVLVLGADGKTGALEVERTLAAGHEVSALLYSSGAEDKHPLPPQVRVVHGDVHDPVSFVKPWLDAKALSKHWAARHHF